MEKEKPGMTIVPMKRYYLDDPEINNISHSAIFIVMPNNKVRRISGLTWFPTNSEHEGKLAYVSYLNILGIPPSDLQKKDFTTLNIDDMSKDEKRHTYLVPFLNGVSEGFYYNVFHKELLLFVSKNKAVSFHVDSRRIFETSVCTFSEHIFSNVIGVNTKVALKCISKMDKLCSEDPDKRNLELDDIFSIAEHVYQK